MLEGLAQIFVELVLLGTGHAVLWAVTLGRWQGFRSSGRAATFWHGFLATFVGFVVWVAIAVMVIAIVVLLTREK